jgi:hypothetical protein
VKTREEERKGTGWEGLGGVFEANKQEAACGFFTFFCLKFTSQGMP